MSLADWFRRMMGSSASASGAETTAGGPASDFVAGGPTGQGFQGLESAEAAEDAIHATDPPEDPAP